MFLLCWLIYLLLIVVFLRAIMSWFPISPHSRAGTAVYWLNRLSEPLMAPIRRFVRPVSLGGAAIDFSAMIVMFALFVLLGIVC